MKKICFVFLLAVMTFLSCRKEIEKPTVQTKEVDKVAETSAVVRGSVSDDGGGEVTSRGFCYGETSNPTIDGGLTAGSGSGVGGFKRTIENLEPNTAYYVRAYAINEAGVSYGEEKTFTTMKEKKLPVVTTKDVEDITTDSAESGGNVTDDGGVEVTARGVCWSTSQNPTIEDNKTTDGTGLGSYTSNLTNLEANTTYYVRAYATNEMGTSYGKEMSFTTLEITPEEPENPEDPEEPEQPEIEKPTVNTKSVSEVTETTAKIVVQVAADGGSGVTERGVCWNTSGSPEIIDFRTVDSGGLGIFTVVINDLEQNTTYYIRGYATNEVGTAYGEELTFTTLKGIELPAVITSDITEVTHNTAVSGGNVTDDGGSEVTARGVCWSTSQNPTIEDNKTTDGSGVGTFTSNLINLTENTTYYVRAYATNEKGTSYGEEKSFKTLKNIELPIVTTYDISSITQTTANCGGYVTSDGNGTITARGVCWSTSSNPTIDDNKTTDGSGVGTFTSNLINLTENTTYYVRAYATNEKGTSYGEEKSFKTEEDDEVCDPDGEIFGHGYVDLGLPSGKKWATCNVGASSPEDYGDYFAWGETSPKANYTDDTYQHWNDADGDGYWEYGESTINSNISGNAQYDAATANWGGSWRMPTEDEMWELVYNCEWEWTQVNGVNGAKVIGPNGSCIFLPAAGYRDGSSLDSVGSYGTYWSSKPGALFNYACDLGFTNGNVYVGGKYRYLGQPVRPITE